MTDNRSDDSEGQGRQGRRPRTREEAERRHRESRRAALRGRESSQRTWLRVIYFTTGLICLVVLVPSVIDFAKGITTDGDDCQITGLPSADTYRLKCPGLGAVKANLLGADTPSARGVGCFAEWVAGQRAKWAVRSILWRADRVDARIDGLQFQGRTLVSVQVDGVGLGRSLVEGGHGRWDDGYGSGGWCSGQLAELEVLQPEN